MEKNKQRFGNGIVNPKKKAEIITFQIYATKFLSYDFFNPFTAKNVKSPIIIENFPEQGNKLSCFFGQIPDHIIKLKYSIDGLGLYNRKKIFGRSTNPGKKEASLEDCILEAESTSDYFQGYCWFTTIILEKAINPYDAGIIDDDEKISPNKAHHFFRDSYQKFSNSEILDKTALCLLIEIDPDFFEVLLMSEVALVTDNNIIAFPRNMATQQEGYSFCERKSINKNKLTRCIKKMNSLNNNWLDVIAHLRMSMLAEKDTWKRYYLGFVCLEVITNKAFERIFAQGPLEPKTKSETNIVEKEIRPTSSSTISKNKMKKIYLLQRFSMVAKVLNPENFCEDISTFEKCKKTRDDMSHGLNQGLPLEELENLLDFYSHEILKLA